MESLDVTMTLTLTAGEYATLCAFAADDVREPEAQLLWIVRQGLHYHDQKQEMQDQISVMRSMIEHVLRRNAAMMQTSLPTPDAIPPRCPKCGGRWVKSWDDDPS